MIVFNTSETWQFRGRGFTVEVVHWTSGYSNRYNIYIWLYPSHKLFNTVGERPCECTELPPMHGGITYLRWYYNRNGTVECKKIGCDYGHSYDDYLSVNDIYRTPVLEDAVELIKQLDPQVVDYTCTNCDDKTNCAYAFDDYCKFGDCLMEK